MKKTKIVIHIEGGNIQAVYTNEPDNPEIRVVDFDNLEETYDRDDRYTILENETDGLSEAEILEPTADNKCDECGELVPLVVGCPGGREICRPCFDEGAG
jgi:formylmethanofuran dehydrogenase subunit E